MKVSVLIPVYNKAPWLRECLDSVWASSFKDLEVVAVDDASTDDSLSILRAIDDPRLRLIELPLNRGPAGAANAGIDACTGEYIVRLDADDIALPRRIEQQVRFMEAHPEVGVSGGAVRLFGTTEAVWRFPERHADCMAQLPFGVPLSQGASIMRRGVVQRHGIRYDPDWPRIGEDWLLWTRLAQVTRMGNLPDALIAYRRGPQNLGHGRDRIADFRPLFKQVFAMLGLALSDADLDLHLWTMKAFPAPPTAAGVRTYHAWLQRLEERLIAHPAFERDAVEHRIARAWDELYHYLPAHGCAPALAHWWLTPGLHTDRLSYLVKVRSSRALGRVR